MHFQVTQFKTFNNQAFLSKVKFFMPLMFTNGSYADHWSFCVPLTKFKSEFKCLRYLNYSYLSAKLLNQFFAVCSGSLHLF